MQPKIKVILADDLKIFREGLSMLLSNQDAIEIIAEASNGNELLEVVLNHRPDIVITDIDMPEMGGVEATREIKSIWPEVEVIALTMFNEDHLIVDMMEAGAKGYLLKNTTKAELTEAIKVVKSGGFYFCQTTSFKLVKLIAASRISSFPTYDPSLFNEKEMEIIQLICKQYSTKEMAPMLDMNHRTIEYYRNKIFEKTGSRSMTGIVIYAMKHRMFVP